MMFNISGLEPKPLPLYRKDVEQALLCVSGVTEVQLFAKVLVRCEFPMSEETMMELQCVQAQIEYATGWKVEMTISAGKRPEPVSPTDNELTKEFAAWERVSDEALANFERSLATAASKGGQ